MTHTKTNTLDALELIAEEQQAISPIARAIAKHPEVANYSEADEVAREQIKTQGQRTHGTLTHPFTPGPWLACPPRNPKLHRHWHVRQNGGDFVCQIEATSGGQIERSEANARLIAAAPALYDMLRQAWWLMYLQGKADCAAAKEWRTTFDQIQGA